MGNKTFIWLIIVIGLFTLISPALAQEMQWLQYRSEREAQQIVGDMGFSGPEVISEKPQGIKLPQFKHSEPLFAKWSTPMVEAGYLWISFDRTHKAGLRDRLFIDSNGNGHLDDETVITAYRTDQYNTYFGPAKVVFEGEDGPLTYHLNFRLYNRSDQYRRLYIHSGCWYEGNIEVAETKKFCVLIDHNVNGTFNDKSIEQSNCDRIRIGKKGDKDTRYVGNFIEIDDVLHRPEIARDGAYIMLSKAEDVKFGNIQIPQTIKQLTVGGENGLLRVKLQNGSGSLPVGKYRINQWNFEKQDEKGNTWNLSASDISQKGDFEIIADKETRLSIGEPILSKLEANKRDSGYSFSQSLAGRFDERIELTRNGSRPPAPKLQIKSKDGSYDRSFSFEYG